MKTNPPTTKRTSNRGITQENNQNAQPLVLFIGVSLKIYDKQGSFTILEAGRPECAQTRVIDAGSIGEISLTAIVDLLRDEAKYGDVNIFIHDERVEANLNNGQLEIWARKGWKASNGKPLKQADLYQSIYHAKAKRCIRVFSDKENPVTLEAKAMSLAALKEQRNPVHPQGGPVFDEEILK